MGRSYFREERSRLALSQLGYSHPEANGCRIGAAPFYGLMPLERCSLLVMNPPGETGAPRGFEGREPRAHRRDLCLHIIERGCTDVCVIAVTGPLTGRVLIGNGAGYWGPNVSSATDFLDWYGM